MKMATATTATHWPLVNTGDWAEDNKAGAKFAENLILDIAADPDKNVIRLGAIVAAMIKKDEYEGAEVGFFHRLSLQLHDPNRKVSRHGRKWLTRNGASPPTN